MHTVSYTYVAGQKKKEEKTKSVRVTHTVVSCCAIDGRNRHSGKCGLGFFCFSTRLAKKKDYGCEKEKLEKL